MVEIENAVAIVVVVVVVAIAAIRARGDGGELVRGAAGRGVIVGKGVVIVVVDDVVIVVGCGIFFASLASFRHVDLEQRGTL